VKVQSDGMESTWRRLQVVRHAISDEKLLLRRHGIELAAAAGATLGSGGDKASAAASAAGTGLSGGGGGAGVGLFGAMSDAVIRLRSLILGDLAARAEQEPEDDDSSSDTDTPRPASAASAAAAASKSPAAARAPGLGGGKPPAAAGAGVKAAPSKPAMDPLVEYVIAQERRRLDLIGQALEAVHEFHRIDKWCYIHLFYAGKGPARSLLEFKQDTLERHAGALFEIVSNNDKLATMDEAALREHVKVLKRFCRNLLDDVETESAMAATKAPPRYMGAAGAGAGGPAPAASGAGAR